MMSNLVVVVTNHMSRYSWFLLLVLGMSATSLIVAKTTLLSRDNLALQLVLVATLTVTENRYVGSRWSHSLNLMQLVPMDSLEVAEDRYMGW